LREVIAWQKVQRNVLSKNDASNSLTKLLKQFSTLGSKEKDLISAVFCASVENNLGDLKKVEQAVINYLDRMAQDHALKQHGLVVKKQVRGGGAE
jgi:hypothetical protein